MQRSPKCREHQILHGRLRADMRVYVDATRRLESCKPEDFDKIYELAESARLEFLKAREAHSCGFQPVLSGWRPFPSIFRPEVALYEVIEAETPSPIYDRAEI
jgi:hypothetical protein